MERTVMKSKLLVTYASLLLMFAGGITAAAAADPFTIKCERGAVITVAAIYNSRTGAILSNLEPDMVGAVCDPQSDHVQYVLQGFAGTPTFASMADIRAFLKDVYDRGDQLAGTRKEPTN